MARQPASIVTLAVSVFAHSILFMATFSPFFTIAYDSVGDLQIFFVASTLASVAGFFVTRLEHYFVIHGVRFALAFVPILLLRGLVPLADLAILVPLIIESSVYLGFRRGAMANAAQIGMYIGSRLFLNPPHGPQIPSSHPSWW
jgi:hypothetical protein